MRQRFNDLKIAGLIKKIKYKVNPNKLPTNINKFPICLSFLKEISFAKAKNKKSRVEVTELDLCLHWVDFQ